MNKLQDYLNNLYPDNNSQSIKLGLDRVLKVKNLLGIEPKFKIITVGGTNGKGSVCAFLESIYSKAGYSVGCFTSPHLYKFNERIKINLEQANDEIIIESLDIIASKKKSIELTYFEITTLAAINIFIKKEVDIAILEVGLGGRLDAVNIFDSELSIITSIGMDHQEFLGDTIEKIGHEKLGICRSNKPAILNFENIPRSMINELNEINASISILNEDYSYNSDFKNYNYSSKDMLMNKLPKPYVKGKNQLINLAGCLRAINLLQNKLPVSSYAVKKGIREVRIEGRLQIVSNEPYIVADVAHNIDAANNLSDFINSTKKSGKIYAVFSILENKDIEQVLMPFINIVDEWFVSEINGPRTQKVDVISNAINKINKQAVINKFENLTKAYKDACKKCSLNDNIIIYGSFFTVSETLNGVIM